MPIQGHGRKLLDEKLCFQLWAQLGSIGKVQSHLKLAGIINPNTTKEFSHMAIWNAAFRWVLENMDEARQIFKDAGSDLNDVQWDEWLIEKAMYVYGASSKGRFMRWIRRMEFEKYDYIYAERYGVEAKHSPIISE
jgi:hypothetical protein